MQVTARVLPAEASWAAVNASRAAVRRLATAPWRSGTVARTGLIRAEAVVHPANGRRFVVTIQYPHN